MGKNIIFQIASKQAILIIRIVAERRPVNFEPLIYHNYYGVSKKSDLFQAGRTEGNTWTIIKKNDEKIKDIIPVLINDAQGVALFGKQIKNKDKVYETI